jgi:hypothetical protein
MIEVNQLRTVKKLESINDIYPDTDKGIASLQSRLKLVKERIEKDTIEYNYLKALDYHYDVERHMPF